MTQPGACQTADRRQPPLDHTPVVRLAPRQRSGNVRRGVVIEARHDPTPRICHQRQLGTTDAQVMVAIAETAFALHRQIEIPEPVALWRDFRRHRHMQREPARHASS